MGFFRALSVVALATFLIGGAYCGVWRTAAMMHEVGMHGWFPESGRTCRGSLIGRGRQCVVRVRDSLGPVLEEYITLDRFRRPTRMWRTWRAPDSAAFYRTQDSVRRVFRGATPLVCDSSPWRRIPTAWQLSRQDIYLFGGHGARATPAQLARLNAHPNDLAVRRVVDAEMRKRSTWTVWVSGNTVDRGCEPRRHMHVRLLTPREMVHAIQRGLAAIWNGDG